MKTPHEILKTLINLHDVIADSGKGITEADWREAREAVAVPDEGEITDSTIKNIQVPREHWDLFAGEFFSNAVPNGNVFIYSDSFYDEAAEIIGLPLGEVPTDYRNWLAGIITKLDKFDGDLCFYRE